MTFAFSTTEVEDGTGKTTSLVFEQPEDSIAWLNRRSKTAFSAALDSDQESAALRATEELGDQLNSLGFSGTRTVLDQALDWPAIGAYARTGETFDSDQIPAIYLEAYRLTAEEIAAGTWLESESGTGAKRIEADDVEIEYSSGLSAASLAANHPEIFRRLKAVLPSGGWQG